MQSATFTLSRLSLPLHNHKSRTPFKHSLHFDPIHFSTSSSKTQRNRHFQWRFLILHSPVLVPPFFLLIQIQAPSFAPSDSVGDSTATPSGTLFKTLELGALFGLWYLFNIYFNIYNKQIEPILSGNLPPGFDSSICRNVYVGNIHSQVIESFLQELFSNAGALEGCKLIRKEKSSYGFVDYFDCRSVLG